ncbi:YycC family protein [Paenibacillus sambharensis]|uniref:YycC family protein n=1 Tax=Paenibacillus sambharensis TaxID=1803190 RepID=A0A2W1L814_9BACL|nr:YycC family protein [Paenibacillus sambharensis]PZD94959.1 YycC family protein [Paenibacillus sambharensis]
MAGPLQISPDTAIKLSKQLGVPLEHLMHMPRHILLQKLAELAATEQAAGASAAGDGPGSTDSSASKEAPRQSDQDEPS